jgi:hypothetical protein
MGRFARAIDTFEGDEFSGCHGDRGLTARAGIY